jgi:dihydropteroate synthase
MLAASRKSTLGLLTGREAHERVHATSATTALAASAKIDFVRVHDIAATFDVVRVCDAVIRRRVIV